MHERARLVAEEKEELLNPYGRTLSVRLKQDDLAALNQRLKLDGFDTLSDLVKCYLDGKISKSLKSDHHLERLLLRLKQKNITDPLTGEVTPTFYKNIDVQDFRQYLKSKYRYSRHGDTLAKSIASIMSCMSCSNSSSDFCRMASTILLYAIPTSFLSTKLGLLPCSLSRRSYQVRLSKYLSTLISFSLCMLVHSLLWYRCLWLHIKL